MKTIYRDYTFLGTTQSLCPECLTLVPAKIIARDGRVYFQKRCPTHGPREDFVCSDVRWFDRTDYSQPGKVPRQFGVEPRLGCPYDCGLCTEHEQHTCVGLLEITSSCNLTCPMCFAASAPGGVHLSVDDCRRAIDRLVEVEGRPEILQLSGGEPTIHPQFMDVFHYACQQPIDIVRYVSRIHLQQRLQQPNNSVGDLVATGAAVLISGHMDCKPEHSCEPEPWLPGRARVGLRPELPNGFQGRKRVSTSFWHQRREGGGHQLGGQ